MLTYWELQRVVRVSGMAESRNSNHVIRLSRFLYCPLCVVSFSGMTCPHGEKVAIGVPEPTNSPASYSPPLTQDGPVKPVAVQFLPRTFLPCYYFCLQLSSQHSLYGFLSFLPFVHQLKYPLLAPGFPPH